MPEGVAMTKSLLTALFSLVVSVAAFADDMPVKCGSLRSGTTVTHYFLPILKEFKNYECKTLEGQCVYMKNGVETLYNDGVGHQPRSQAKCKYGYGNRSNCLTPCLSVAADRRFHNIGETLYFPNLKGTICNGKPHDGIVRVDDVGGAIKGANRFDFYMGECRSITSGVCFDPPGMPLQQKMDKSSYCVVPKTAPPVDSATAPTPEVAANRRFNQTYCHTTSGITYRETQIDSEGMLSGDVLSREGQQVLEIPKYKIQEKSHFNSDNPIAKSAYEIEFLTNNRILRSGSDTESTTVFEATIKISRKDGKDIAPGVKTIEETASCKDEWSFNK